MKKCSCNWHTIEEAEANGIHKVTRAYCIGNQTHCKECGFEFNNKVTTTETTKRSQYGMVK